MPAKYQRSIVFTQPQIKWLQQRAKALGITVSDVIRRMIDDTRIPREGVGYSNPKVEIVSPKNG